MMMALTNNKEVISFEAHSTFFPLILYSMHPLSFAKMLLGLIN